MKKIKLVNVAVPEIVAYFSEGSNNENFEPDWECPNCGFWSGKRLCCLSTLWIRT